jgi:hypothetical protein
MDITEEIIFKKFANVFNLEYNKKREEWINKCTFEDKEGKKEVIESLIPMKHNKLKKLIQSLKKSEFEDLYIYNSNYYEKLVDIPSKEENDMDVLADFVGDFEDKDILIKDSKKSLTFEISSPSLDFIIASYVFFIDNKNSIKSLDECPALFQSKASKLGLFKIHTNFETRENIISSLNKIMNLESERYRAIIDDRNKKNYKKMKFEFENVLVNGLFRNVKTVKILSKIELNLDTFEKLYDSFIFSLGYNINMPVLEFRHLKEDIDYNPRLKLDEIEIPKRSYIKELIYYYQQALSADNSLLEYLSFYQILEYFYSIVAREDLIRNVKDKLSHPNFSHTNDESILQLIDIISKCKFEEPRALILVLKRYLKLDELKNDLINYCKNENYFDYYIKNKINFADAEPIKENNNKIIMDTLSNRIYNVRNALIHSKEGEKRRYVPFSENENELRKELPLIRLVAEQIIINSSKNI